MVSKLSIKMSDKITSKRWTIEEIAALTQVSMNYKENQNHAEI